MPDDPPLPTVHDAMLDDAGVEALFAELARDAGSVDVRLKGDVQVRAEGTAGLSEAKTMLLEGKVFGVQLRYRLGGVAWLTTLMQTPTGVRLVRIEQPW